MQLLEVSGAVRPLEWSLGVKGLREECSRVIAITRFHRLSLWSVHEVPALFAEYNQQDATFYNFIECPCNIIDIFIITNTMHTIGVDKITLFKTT